MGKIDSKTLATLNFMLGTLQGEISSSYKMTDRIENLSSRITKQKLVAYLSFDAVITTGNNFEQVISGPITGARRETARRMVIRYK